MLGDFHREQHVGHLVGAGLRAGHHLELRRIESGIVARLHQEPAGHRAKARPRCRRVRHPVGHQHPQILRLGKDRQGLRIGAGRHDHLGEDRRYGPRRRLIEWPVEGDDPAESADRIGPQRQPIRLLERGSQSRSAGIGMLDDHRRRRRGRIELGDAFERRIGIGDIVVGKLLALQLSRRRHPGRGSPVA